MSAAQTNKQPVAVVSGASSGIGAEVVRQLHDAGWVVIGIDRSAESDADTHIQADLSLPDAVSSFADTLPDRVDLLCNIAGVPGTAPASTVLSVNVSAVQSLSRALASRLSGGGSIVNLASLAASSWRERTDLALRFIDAASPAAMTSLWHDLPDSVNAYAFSKECVIVMTQLLASEFHTAGIRVNSVSPGPVETPILKDFRQDLGRDKVDNAKEIVGRLGGARDIAGVVISVGTDPALSWLNGCDIVADGGLHAMRQSILWKGSS